MVKFRIASRIDRACARQKLLLLYASLALIVFGPVFVTRSVRAAESARIHWGSVSEAQVKVDQTTPLTWGVYQAEKKGKPDKKFSNLVLLLIGHRYLLVDLKGKHAYEVPLAELHKQDDGFDTGDLAASSRELPTSEWTWQNVGPAELYRVTLGDYGRVLRIILPHPYLVSPYY